MPLSPDDPCACGSGRKYKDCCQAKDEMTNYRREQFYKKKQHMVEKIGYFLESKIFYADVMTLKQEFTTRTRGLIDEDMQDSFMVFWFVFYHEFENGLRGIDWFNQERRDTLNDEETMMLDAWRALEPRMLQLVDQDGPDVAIFEDMDTGQRFPFSVHPENVARAVPWLSTFAMIEAFDGLYYFNGFYMGVGPKQLWQAEQFVTKKMKETGLARAVIFKQFFPEITAALLDQETELKLNGTDVEQHTFEYTVQDMDEVRHKLADTDLFVPHQEDEGKFVWLGETRFYADSAFDDTVKVADEKGTVAIKDNRALIFETLDDEVIEDWHELVDAWPVEMYESKARKLGVAEKQPYHVHVYLDLMDRLSLQKYASFNDETEITRPLAMFSGKSVSDLQAAGETAAVEMWLRNEEYVMYRRVLGTEGKVEISADFNRLRRRFERALSPFVTGGKKRETSFTIEDA